MRKPDGVKTINGISHAHPGWRGINGCKEGVSVPRNRSERVANAIVERLGNPARKGERERADQRTSSPVSAYVSALATGKQRELVKQARVGEEKVGGRRSGTAERRKR